MTASTIAPRIVESDRDHDREIPQVLLSVRDLTVRFPGRRTSFFSRAPGTTAVNNVSLTVHSGEVVGIVGESGSGKSTLARVITGFAQPSNGAVQLLGRQMHETRGKALRHDRVAVQMIFQDPVGALDPQQTVRAAFQEIRRLHPDRTRWSSDAKLMELVGLPQAAIDRYPHELSGGQAQRVAIARALLVRPALLIADEATSALDVSVQAQILNLLLDLRDETKVAILLISHDLSVVRQTCDFIHVMFRGEVVEAGEAETVLTKPRHVYTQSLVAIAQQRSRYELR